MVVGTHNVTAVMAWWLEWHWVCDRNIEGLDGFPPPQRSIEESTDQNAALLDAEPSSRQYGIQHTVPKPDW